MHSRRRRACGLAALSLTATGAMMIQPGSAPGTAKEPRPASHFRLVLQSTGTYSGKIRPNTITLREIAPRQVMTYRAGRKLQKDFPTLKARIADTFTKAQSDQRFLLRSEAAGLLSKLEAEQTYAKKSGVVAGSGTLLSGVIAGTGTQATVLSIPGLADITGASGGGAGSTFRVVTASSDPIYVNTTGRVGGSTVAGAPFELDLGRGVVATLQLVRSGSVATETISASESANNLLSAQALVSP